MEECTSGKTLPKGNWETSWNSGQREPCSDFRCGWYRLRCRLSGKRYGYSGHLCTRCEKALADRGCLGNAASCAWVPFLPGSSFPASLSSRNKRSQRDKNTAAVLMGLARGFHPLDNAHAERTKKSHSNTLIVRYRNGLLNKDDFRFIWTQFPSPFSIFLQIPDNLLIRFLFHG